MCSERHLIRSLNIFIEPKYGTCLQVVKMKYITAPAANKIKYKRNDARRHDDAAKTSARQRQNRCGRGGGKKVPAIVCNQTPFADADTSYN